MAAIPEGIWKRAKWEVPNVLEPTPPFGATEEVVRITVALVDGRVIEALDTAENAYEAWEGVLAVVRGNILAPVSVAVESWMIPTDNIETLTVEKFDGRSHTTPTRREYSAWTKRQHWNGINVRFDGHEYS